MTFPSYLDPYIVLSEPKFDHNNLNNLNLSTFFYLYRSRSCHGLSQYMLMDKKLFSMEKMDWISMDLGHFGMIKYLSLPDIKFFLFLTFLG